MSRYGARKTASDLTPRLPAHVSLLDSDLVAWAGESTAHAGRRDALLGRVELLRLAPNGRVLEATVRDSRPRPYRAQVWVERDGLACRCTCDRGAPPACKHVVAALEALRFPLSRAPRESGGRRRRAASGPAGRGRGRVIQPGAAQPGYLLFGGAERSLTRDERVQAAGDEERAARRARARRERAIVTPLPSDGGPPRFEVTPRQGALPQQVTLRGPKAKLGACTCDDFAKNELRTCRHIERVQQWYLRKQKQVLDDLLSVWWQPRDWTARPPDPLCEIRIDSPSATVPDALAVHFDDSGWMRPAPAEFERAAWAFQAIELARETALLHGWRADIDPGVESRTRRAAARRETEELLAAAGLGGDVWREVLSRVKLELHPYQETGAQFLARKGRAMLADEMGLGKTVQAIVAALLLRRVAGAQKALVVCPASLKHQWRREIDKSCGEFATVVEGPQALRLRAYREWREGFLILNYELVLRDLDAVRAMAPDLVILDEAQRIKNWDTKTARAVKRVDSRFAFILTGTPLENRLLELHSLVEFLHPRVLGPRWRLLPFHAVTEPQGRVIAYEGLDILRRRLSSVFLRRDRESVLDQLPARTDNTFWTGMTAMQRRPYRRCAATIGALLSRSPVLRPGEIRALLQALTTMRILCNAWAQFEWEQFAERLKDPAPPTRAEIKGLGSPKLEEFARVLEDLLDDSSAKVVVFSQWERILRLAHFVVREVLERRELRADVFHGGLNSRAREEMLEAFRVDPEFHVLFSTDAGGLGLNLQESASIVVNLEVPWNPATLAQRTGRVYRIGQRRSVQVLHFVTRGAIEERVRQVVEGKRALFEGLMSDDVERIVFDENGATSFLRQVQTLLKEA